MTNSPMTALNKQAPRMRNYLDTALKSGVKLLHLSTDEFEGLLDELEAAEKRIAELEALTVNLPKRSVGEVMHMSGFSRDYAEGWCSGNDNAIHEIRAAGISVKER